jgi:hypothetical protein
MTISEPTRNAMPSNDALDQPSQVRRVWLSIAALIIGGVIFAPFYVLLTIHPFLPTSFRVVPYWYQLIMLFQFLHALLFSRAATYLLISLLGIGAALMALLWARPHWIVRVLLILTLLAILAFPWFYRYQPAVVGAPGYEIRVPTQPGLLDGVTKRAQEGAEIRPCEYALLGWLAEGVLYYEAACGKDSPQIWSFAPDQSGDAQRIPSAPQGLIRRNSQTSALNWVRAAGVRSVSEELNARRVYVQDGSLASLDDRWVALVARHLYGPEDVVTVTSVGGE